jgi:hypothetical protein
VKAVGGLLESGFRNRSETHHLIVRDSSQEAICVRRSHGAVSFFKGDSHHSDKPAGVTYPWEFSVGVTLVPQDNSVPARLVPIK